MIDLHLLRIIRFEHRVLVYLFLDEAYRRLAGNLYRCFSLFLAVEPCFRPPSDTCLVGIHSHQSWYVEALHVYLQPGERVDDAACGYGPVDAFFLSLSLNVERNT